MGDRKALNAALAKIIDGPPLELSAGRLSGIVAVLESLR